jgi:hypothetical protein
MISIELQNVPKALDLGSLAFSERGSACIASGARTLEEALALSALPRLIKAKHPELKVKISSTSANRAVFRGNPYVDGFRLLPPSSSEVIEGASPLSKPEIYLQPRERAWIDRFLEEKTFPQNRDKPLCLLHPWGNPLFSVAPVEFWDAIIQRWSHRYRFWQMGWLYDSAAQGCEYYFLIPSGIRHHRRLFALISRAQRMIGVESGLLQAASAFDLPRLGVTTHGRHEEEIADERNSGERIYWNQPRVAVSRVGSVAAQRRVDAFLESGT